jgi:hypothetical protein
LLDGILGLADLRVDVVPPDLGGDEMGVLPAWRISE